MSKTFQLDVMALAAVDHGAFGIRQILDEVARQIHNAGGPEGDLDAQLRTLLVGHEAMRAAWEKMPSVEDIVQELDERWGDDDRQDGDVERAHIEIILARLASTFARLWRERDDIKSNVLDAIRSAPVVPMVGNESAALDDCQAMSGPLKSNGEVLQGILERALRENEELHARLAKVKAITVEDIDVAYNGEHQDASPERVLDLIRSCASSETDVKGKACAAM